MFPNSLVLKNDPNYMQGVPDLVVLFGNGKWATLEVKQSGNSSHRPNQDYWVKTLDDWGFSAFIYPENEKDVFYGLERTLQS